MAEVYVVEENNNRIQRFDPGGTFITAWGNDVDTVGNPNICTVDTDCVAASPGALGGEMDGPNGVATDFHGNAYVADTGNQRIQKFDSSGAWQNAWGRGVAGASGFQICTVANTCTTGQAGGLGGDMNGPAGVASDASGSVYVAEAFGNRVSKFLDRPPPPVVTGTSPASPANDNAPKVQGTATAGTTVSIYGDPLCSGSALATGSGTEFASPGIAVTVPDDSTTLLAATATDDVNATSACSSFVTYFEDSTGPDTVIDTSPTGTIASTMPAFTFHSTEHASTFECRFDAADFAPCSGLPGTHSSPFPLADGAHTFEVRARDLAGNADATPAASAFTVDTAQTGPPPDTELPPPVQGRLVNAIPEKGTVLVKLPAGANARAHAAATGFVPLETVGRQLPVGSTLDTTKGTVLLTAATNTSGGTQDGHISDGLFKLGQAEECAHHDVDDRRRVERVLEAPARRLEEGRAAAKKRRRTLFSNVKGRFRTRGRNSTATVRGTKWTMTDTCKGTRTSVKSGSVTVHDFTLKKTRIVRASQSYLARAPLVKKRKRR